MSLNRSQLHQDKKKTAAPSYQKKNPNVKSLEIELDQDAIDYYRSQGYTVEYIDGGDVPEFEEGGIISDHGWEYKQEGDNILTKQTDSPDWITATGDAKKAIQDKHFAKPAPPAAIETGHTQLDRNERAASGEGIRFLQQGLADNDYYLGPKGVDGFDGDFTQEALRAQQNGISAEDYNKRFSSQELSSLPGVNVPSSVVENAQGNNRPVSSRLSAAAETSIQENETPNSNAVQVDKEKGWSAPKAEEYTYSPIVDLGDEVYQHVDDFIYDTDDLQPFSDVQESFKQVHVESDHSCLKGALNCNAQFVSQKTGAQSVRGLMTQLERADQTRYSIPSRDAHGDSDFKHSPGYDAWEISDALVGEGLATDMWRIEPGSDESGGEGKEWKVPKDLDENYIKAGKIPLGAMVMQGEANRDSHRLNDEQGMYTPKEYGGKSSHASGVVGFAKDGVPLIYDYGKLRRIDDPLLAINRIVIPKGYENYTYGNLQKGKKARLDNLGYKKEDNDSKFVVDKDLKPYVNNIRRGTHKNKVKIGSDYNIKSDVMDKLADRVIGISGRETNFGNHGKESISAPRRALIELESDWTSNTFKPAYKTIQEIGVDEKKGKADWEIEIMANEALGLGETYNHDKIEHRNAFKEKYKELRAKHPRSTGKDKDVMNSSVGPFALKNLSKYAQDELGLDKNTMYGMSIDDKDEFERGAQGSLVHLVEDYVNLRSKYPRDEYTDDQIIDLATIAYNNKGKAYSEEFAEYFIKNKQSGRQDNYLEDVKKLEHKYGYNSARKKQYDIDQRAAKSAAWAQEHEGVIAPERTQEEQAGYDARSQRASDTVPEIRAESTGMNQPAANYYPNIQLNAPGQGRTSVKAAAAPRSRSTPKTPPNLHRRNFRKDGGEAKDFLKDYVLRNL